MKPISERLQGGFISWGDTAFTSPRPPQTLETNMTNLIALVHTTAVLTGLILGLICMISAVRIELEQRSGSRSRNSSKSRMDSSIAA
jgi:hypothetical protein